MNRGIGQRVGVNMNKRFVIILSSLITVVVLVIVGFFYLINHSNVAVNKTPAKKVNASGYTVQKGAETLAKIAAPAVEAYANKDVSESTQSRNERLKKYFALDSPVFNGELDIRTTNSAIKTTAKAKSVVFSEGEGDYPNLIVTVDLTVYSGNTKNTSPQKYWVTIKKDSSGNNVAFDIGMVEG